MNKTDNWQRVFLSIYVTIAKLVKIKKTLRNMSATILQKNV